MVRWKVNNLSCFFTLSRAAVLEDILSFTGCLKPKVTFTKLGNSAFIDWTSKISFKLNPF